MKEINVLLTECSDKFSQTGEFRILKTYRTRDNRLSFDERLSIIKSVERAYEPLFELIKNDAPNLTDSDLIFYVNEKVLGEAVSATVEYTALGTIIRIQ